MKRIKFIPGFVILLLILGACTKTNPSQMNDSAKKSIHEFYEQWFGSMENKDIDSFLALLADDFYLKSPASPAISDTTELRTGLEQYHQAYDSEVDWQIEEIQLFNDHAVVRVTESITLIAHQSDDTNQISGVHLAILTRSGNNNWKLKTDVSSLNHPVSDQ